VKYLLDVNVLVALTNEDHAQHKLVQDWFNASGHQDWGVCTLTEAGFLRVSSNPKAGQNTVDEAVGLLKRLAEHPGYRYWPIDSSWTALTAPFVARIFGHQQISDALFLGLAVKENGVLVTMDKGIRYLAEPGLLRHLLVLQ
jgi:toxin-antitoxin system PIN domain toxin